MMDYWALGIVETQRRLITGMTVLDQSKKLQAATNAMRENRVVNVKPNETRDAWLREQMAKPRAPKPTRRTQEEIIRDCEKRYAELEAEKVRRDEAERKRLEDPAVQFPCETCRWREGVTLCSNALVKGFETHTSNFDFLGNAAMRLCGPEKALWEPVPERRTISDMLSSDEWALASGLLTGAIMAIVMFLVSR